ncbi:MAG TPA: SusC/RagA family TonB-linked outer membrane protein [Porphyromonadaceae bacterium]|jgi:TonB-linked SusC/RagA family outer membrane protein|nr:SusC/RagA family TonB-linked outer membrane protein [Porphyromonadaceae bacterium]HCM22191.1 SusC/RagA family TonB-linked outer membrane protein [Porphyromonadaceae bacterium]
MNKTFKIIKFVSIFVLLGTFNSFAGNHAPDTRISLDVGQQKRQVSGIVTDHKGEAIIGANVIEKGTTNGTVTDINGNFTLQVEGDAILHISYIGYQVQDIPSAGKTNFEVVLQEDSKALDEVVVVGYGTMRKKDLTGAVAAVDGKLLETRKSTHLTQALQGALPGVTITRSSGDPKEGAGINIRGITSINESTPLVIVDGVPGIGINNINARDVESISVLKDGASASIYGARAAAGVVLITTKRAKEGELNIGYDFNYGFERPSALPEFVDVKRWMEICNEIAWNKAGNDANEYPIYSKDLIENYDQLNADDPDSYPITDWYNLTLKDYAPKQSHAVRLSFGSEKIKSSVSMIYEKQDKLPKSQTETSYKRFSVRANNELTINKYWTATADIYYRRAISKDFNNAGMGDGTIFTQLFYYAPIYPAVWSNGTLAPGLSAQNVYGMLNWRGFDNYWDDKVGGRIAIDFNPLKGLKISAVVAPNINNYKRKIYYKVVPYYEKDNPNATAGNLRWSTSTDLDEYRNNTYNITSQLLANYDKKLGEHTLNVLAGYEQYYYTYESLIASSDQFELADFPYLDLGNPNYITNSGSATENAYRSFFGRISYNFHNKYFLQFNSRYDGSSRFHPDHRWGYFPSFSGGWVLTEEPFMQDFSPFLSFLKLRASWGRLGNERIGDYPYQSTISFSNAHINKGNDKVSVKTAAQRAFAVENISWETTESVNLGLDIYLLNNKLSVASDYFIKNTKDMLLKVDVPDFAGLSDPNQNAGKMKTIGWEIDLKWNDHIGDLKYSVSANLSDYKSKMVDLKGTEFLGEQVKKEGSEFNEWYGYKTMGLFQTQEDLDNSAVISANQKVGDIKYRDISGPEGSPDGIINSYDRTLLGGSLPRYLYGLNLDVQYKNFDLSVMFQGVGKQVSKMQGLMYYAKPGDKGNIPKIIDGKYWSHYNTEEENLNAKYPRLEETSGSAYTFSDMWLFDGAYLRLKNITLGYNFSDKIFRQKYFKSLRVYASITDLFSIDHYPKGWDSEANSSTYPITASYVFGISINL